MIDMEKYKRRIMNIDKEVKVKKNIRNSIIVFNLYVCIGVIALVLFLVGIIGLINETNNGRILYGIGMGILLLDIIMLLSYETLDPLKNYSINDKVFIYLNILYENLDNKNKVKSVFKKQYLFRIVKKVNSQFYIIKRNIEDTFIFRDENYKYYTKYLDKFVLLFHGKDYQNENFIRVEEIRKCIFKIINIYEFNIVNEFVNEDLDLNFKEIRVEKIEDLIKNIDFILAEDVKYNNDFKTNVNSKSKFSIKLLLLVFLNIMPVIFIAFNKNDIISFIFTVYSPIMSVNIWAWTNRSK